MKKLLIAVAATTLISAAALAETTPATSTTTEAPKLIDKVTASFYGSFMGPSLGDPNALQPKVDGSRGTTKQRMDSSLMAGYKLTPQVKVTGSYNFFYYPVMGHDIVMKDPHISVSHNKLYDKNGLNLTADLRTYLPFTTASSTTNDMKIGVRSTQLLTWEIPNSRWTVGTWTYVKSNVLGSGHTVVEDLPPDWILYYAAHSEFKIKPNLQATWYWEADHAHALGGGWDNEDSDMGIGVNWDVTSKISLNPYVQIYPGHLRMNSSQFGMIISAAFL